MWDEADEMFPVFHFPVRTLNNRVVCTGGDKTELFNPAFAVNGNGDPSSSLGAAEANSGFARLWRGGPEKLRFGRAVVVGDERANLCSK